MLLQIDTGSSDIWVQIPTSSFCQEGNCATGTYDNISSSTYEYVNSLFDIPYGDHTFARGDYALETFQIGGTMFSLYSGLTIDAEITNMEFGIGIITNATPAVMGIGYESNEAITLFQQPPYPNLVDVMVSEGLIESQTYSLYLNDIEASTGVILFGGVDVDKFSGTLQTLPINTDNGIYSRLMITLTDMTISIPGNPITEVNSSSIFPLSVVLDSGTTLGALPTPIVESLAEFFGAQFQDGLYILPNCDALSVPGTVDFYFSGIEISVPFNEILVDVSTTSPVCAIGILAMDSPCGILGDTFLRSAYVVYDLVFSSPMRF